MSKKSIIIPIIILVLVLAGAWGYVTLFKKPAPLEQPPSSNIQNTQPLPSAASQADQSNSNQNNPNVSTATTDLSGYEFIKLPTNYGFNTDANANYEFNTDLNNDGKNELTRFYWDVAKQTDTCEKIKPIVMKIFSGNDPSKEVYSFKYNGSNLIGRAEAFQNFWGDGMNAIMGEGISYACGSGYGSKIMFFAYRQGQYQAIAGPQTTGAMYKFAGENGIGKKIITAEAYWSQNLTDYCAGCNHRLQFAIYNWDGQKYTKTLAGITQNKYLSETIDQVLQKEPSVLNQ